MRVALVTTRFDLIGGSERYAGEAARALAAAGDGVRVLCAGGDQDAGVPVRELAALAAPSPDRSALRELTAALADRDATLLTSRVAAPVLEALLAGPPVVRFVQDHTLFCPGLNKQLADGGLCEEPVGVACLRRYWLQGGCAGQRIVGAPSLRGPLRELAARRRELDLTARCARTLVASGYMRAELLRAGLPPGRVEVLPYFTRSTDPARAATPPDDATRAFWAADGALRLFASARLVHPDKGVDFLVTAMGKLAHPARLVVAGDGPAREWLERKAREEGLSDRIRFVGWRSPAEVEGLYAAAEAVAFPSVWNEPFGLVGVEAMAHGLPVVAADVGGVREWLEPGETGLLVPRRDADALAAAVDRLAADRELARRLGAAGARRVAERFSEEGHLTRLRAILADPG